MQLARLAMRQRIHINEIIFPIPFLVASFPNNKQQAIMISSITTISLLL